MKLINQIGEGKLMDEDNVNQDQLVNDEEILEENQPKNKRTGWFIVLSVLIVFMLLWVVVRPGIFTIQPIGALPEGVTIIYSQRGPEMPFFSSPDRMCLDIQGSVSLMCRGMTIAAAGELFDRIIIRLPYIEWAYLRSTEGRVYDR